MVLPVLFLAAAFAAYAVVGAYVFETVPSRITFVIGAGLMVLYVFAYVDWHVLQLGESLLSVVEADHGHSHGDHGSHGHDDVASIVLVDHLREDPVALVSKVVELIAVGLLVGLSVWSGTDQ